MCYVKKPLIFELTIHNAKVLLEQLVPSPKKIRFIEAILNLEGIRNGRNLLVSRDSVFSGEFSVVVRA